MISPFDRALSRSSAANTRRHGFCPPVTSGIPAFSHPRSGGQEQCRRRHVCMYVSRPLEATSQPNVACAYIHTYLGGPAATERMLVSQKNKRIHPLSGLARPLLCTTAILRTSDIIHDFLLQQQCATTAGGRGQTIRGQTIFFFTEPTQLMNTCCIPLKFHTRPRHRNNCRLQIISARDALCPVPFAVWGSH